MPASRLKSATLDLQEAGHSDARDRTVDPVAAVVAITIIIADIKSLEDAAFQRQDRFACV